MERRQAAAVDLAIDRLPWETFASRAASAGVSRTAPVRVGDCASMPQSLRGPCDGSGACVRCSRGAVENRIPRGFRGFPRGRFGFVEPNLASHAPAVKTPPCAPPP
jgi:hypothetical protein